MPSKKQITISDVAAAAGVSPATVSRVLSGNEFVIDDTKEKVLRAVEQTGYKVTKPKTKQALAPKSILIICSSLRDQGSSYFLEGIERKADEAGYTSFIKYLTMSQIVHGGSKADEIMSWVRDCKTSGVLIFSDAVDADVIRDVSSQIPVTTMMTEFSDPKVSSVDVDETDMMRKSIQHLINSGKTKIALITGQTIYRRCRVLKDIHRSLIIEAGLRYSPDWCANIDTNYHSTSAAIAAEQMLRSADPPDAFITSSDIYASGVIYACNSLKLRVPEDVAVLGRDNSSVCHISTPQITAFNMPAEMIGYTACSSLISRIEEPSGNIRNILLTCDLIVRESTESPGK